MQQIPTIDSLATRVRQQAARYRRNKRYVREATGSAQWSAALHRCKRTKAKLALLAAWLHVRLWAKGATKVPPSSKQRAYTMRELVAALDS